MAKLFFHGIKLTVFAN